MKLISKNGYGIFERDHSVYFIANNSFYRYDFVDVIEIPKTDFLYAKYGKNNKFWDKPFHEFGRLKNGNFVSVFYQENVFRVHSPDGQIFQTIETIRPRLNYGGIYGMAVDKNNDIWIAAPVEHYLGKFNLEGEELFSITCDDSLEPIELNYPENVCAIEESVFVSELGNKRIVKLNINNYEMENFKFVSKPIYYYSRLNGKEIYQFDTGVYVD